MTEFIASTADCSPKCTYCLSNTNLIPQPIYICHTCSDSLCCCVGCSTYCHDGHDVEYFAHGKAYCDCGANSYGNGITCALSESSNIAASTILASNNNFPITLDDDGRIGTTATTNLVISDFSIHEYNIINNDNNYSINNLDVLKEQCTKLAQISKDTFWINSNQSPRNILEKYALEIFHYHTQNTTYNFDISGAEYWVQIKNVADNNNGIDLHYDKDEEIAKIFEIGIFPQISTVSYLTSSCNNPTIIYKKTNDNNIDESNIQNCWISFPRTNKHISFDGRYLHGAPSVLSQYIRNGNVGVENNSNIRITFLVNIWLNHHPYNINPISSDIINMINNNSTTGDYMNSTIVLTNTNQCSPTLLHINEEVVSAQEDGNGSNIVMIPFISDESQWGKDVNETGIVLKMWLPNNYAFNNDHGNYIIHYDADLDACYLEYELDEEELVNEVEDDMNL